MEEKDFQTLSPNLQAGARMHGFVVERAETLPEISGCAYIMRHEATRARLMWLACADDNKAFSISFKTPPVDDTGVFHINEHSVLCGSDKFPVKEPFVNLLKTSMQTFLNALTFPDKTMYPVSSTNEQDLRNLMDVYLDAVLHPAIYQRPRIFEQEGWHYEVDADGALVRNGVVFNEMKGALSDPDSMLMLQLNRQLFPDNAYGFESGGTPGAIPELTYEAFLDANARHYRLDNSYSVLYGDLDIDAMLGFIDEHFSHQEDRGAGAPNPLVAQKPLVAPTVLRQMPTAPENAAVGVGYVFATADERTRVLAASVLLDALTGSNEAPLKRAILSADLGDDVVSYLIDSELQPYVFLELKGAKPGVVERFQEVVKETCTRLSTEGIDRERLESAIAQVEFALREGERGMSDGVALAIIALSGWLYDDSLATAYLRYEDALTELHMMVENGGFEQLMRDIFLECPHQACVVLEASDTTEAASEARELAHVAEELGEAGMAAVAEEAAALHAEQEAPDTPEGLATLPQLHVTDIGPAPVRPTAIDVEDAPLACVGHELSTHGIDYLYCYFGLEGIAWDELPYVSVLSRLLGKLSTRSHDADSLNTYIDRNLGTLAFFCESNGVMGSDAVRPLMVVGASALSSKIDSLAAIPREVWSQTLFNDRERIVAILSQVRLGFEQSMATEGHAWASSRAAGYSSRAALLTQQLSGVDFYVFLRDLLDHIDERFEDLVAKLEDISARIFTADRLLVSFIGSADERARFWNAAGDLGLSHTSTLDRLVIPAPQALNEAFIVPANGCFVAQAVPGGARVPRVNGSWLVAASALTLDYLWNEVRVKGGAYGVGFSTTFGGRLQWYSYRDPAVDPTIARFGACADWLSNWNPDRNELEGYIVSGVAKLDAPVKPRALARSQDIRRFCGITEESRAELRDELLHATPESVRALSDTLRELSAARTTCVFGGRDQIEASKQEFRVVTLQ